MHRNASWCYRETDILTSRPEVLVARLLARAAARAEQAAGAIEAGRWEEGGQALGSVQAILAELREALDLKQGELAANLDRLYAFCQTSLLDGSLHRDPGAIRSASRILGELGDAWTQAAGLSGGEGL